MCVCVRENERYINAVYYPFMCLQQGPPQYTFYFEDDPKDKYKIAIYTSVNKVRYYLQPSNDATNTIVASKSELPKDYPFKFPA